MRPILASSIVRATAFFVALLATDVTLGQLAPCGISSIKETVDPQYLPIARAAHVQGTVILMASFALDGHIDHVHVLSGPVMLNGIAIDYVKGWTANEYTGPRNCPIILHYDFSDSTAVKAVADRVDVQHVSIHVPSSPCLCDPGAELGKRKRRFLLF